MLEEENEIALKYFKKFSWVSESESTNKGGQEPEKAELFTFREAPINSYGSIQNDVLVHEMVHVWQYFEKGLVYIPRALWAQKTNEGYNYGEKKHLKGHSIRNWFGFSIMNNKQHWSGSLQRAFF
ncbi:MAG: hypothetical protein R2769_05130 [Saprospiraceae bacterium]